MNDTSYADAAIKQLQKKHDRPFLIACGLFHPHMPWSVPQKYFDMLPMDEVTTPVIMGFTWAKKTIGRNAHFGRKQHIPS